MTLIIEGLSERGFIKKSDFPEPGFPDDYDFFVLTPKGKFVARQIKRHKLETDAVLNVPLSENSRIWMGKENPRGSQQIDKKEAFVLVGTPILIVWGAVAGMYGYEVLDLNDTLKTREPSVTRIGDDLIEIDGGNISTSHRDDSLLKGIVNLSEICDIEKIERSESKLVVNVVDDSCLEGETDFFD